MRKSLIIRNAVQWWWQTASGDLPFNRTQTCSVVSASPDNSAFHITMYGGWSLLESRAFEDVYVLSIPSFTCIDVTSVAKGTNLEQQLHPSIGRSRPVCNAYKNAEMIILGGNVRKGGYSVTSGQCSTLFAPVRVLDLSTYHWRTSLNTNPAYKVPSAISDVIGGEYVRQILVLIAACAN